MQREKDGLLLKREASDNMKSSVQIKKFYTEELRRLQAQKSTICQDIEDAKRDQKSFTQQLNDYNHQLLVAT